jgi:ubiquinone/menaquinone biosynthesis C-methylase UbiE/uncharacterized protein YbaR (Trm112 family)
MQYAFPKKLISSLVCQKDKQPLSEDIVWEGDEKKILKGSLVCKQCRTAYEIKDGILDLLMGQQGLDDILTLEIKERDKQADSYDKRMSIRYEREVPSTIKQLGDYRGKKLIDYGCGTGRITEELLACDAILAADFSRQSLLEFAKKLGDKDNVGLVLADVSQLVTAPEYFALALSSQVYEHIPTKEPRLKHLKNISETLAANGRFVCSAYYHDLRRRLRKEPIEGYHEEVIFYHYFTLKEIKDEFKAVFKIKRAKIIDITLPLETRLGLSKMLGGYASRVFENFPLVNSLGHLVLLTAVNKQS